jgi:glycosyl transferase, family 25
MTVPVYIITLASATQRRAFQEVQAQRLGFSPIWHPAMGVNDFSDEVFLQHAFSWQRPLKKSEVGCFLSHLQVWQRIARSSGPAVVLEDDVILADHWLEVVQHLSDFSRADLINLEAVGKKQLAKSHIHNSYKLQRLVLNSSGAGAYMLWPQGAAKLIQRYAKDGAALADVFINETRSLSAWQLVPTVVIQQCMLPYYGLPVQQEGASQIAREKFVSPTPPHWLLALAMRWRRIAGEFRKGALKLGVLIGHERQFVPYLHHQRHR